MFHLDILLVIGLALAAGWGGAEIFKWIKMPQVVGYIVMGLLVGSSGLGILRPDIVSRLDPLTNFTLGIIGFMIGGELRFSVFKRIGKSAFVILFAEVFAAFALVALAVWLLTGKMYMALIFGSLATATAPAATVDVLWEYRSKGILTSTIMAIVGLDDALALIVYGFASSTAKILIGFGSFSVARILYGPLMELGGSMALGITAGLGIEKAAKLLKEQDKKQFLTLIIFFIMIVSGFAHQFHFSQILACMFMGMTLGNRQYRLSERASMVMEGVTAPIYTIFFIIIGAKLKVGLLPQMGWLGLCYIGGRTAGKLLGSYLGAVVSKAEEVVRKYLGWALFSQAGVAIGLSIAVASDFGRLGPVGQELGTMVINIIAATTFIVQIIGPPCVKYSITKAGEVGEKI
ncbi:MAG: cation:proton antiporter [bacterium]